MTAVMAVIDAGQHIGLAKAWARKLTWEADDPDEIESVAMEAIVRAARDFDPARGCRFSTVAVRYIRQAVQAHHRQQRAKKRDFRRRVALSDGVVRWHGAPAEPSAFEIEDARRDAANQLAELTQGVLPEVVDLLKRRAGGESLDQVGRHMGLSKSRVKQLEDQALRHIRERHGIAETRSMTQMAAAERRRVTKTLQKN